MKVMSLFAGIGGFDLAADWMGWETVVQVELDEWCRKVLAKNFPNAYRHDDIKTFDATPYRGTVDLVCGGFPCQPYSHAGKRLGKNDDRHLWPEMLRIIREVQPTFVVGENVSGLLSWNVGMVFNEVQTDLEASGYEVQSFVLPACGVNAPHRRDRVWIVAHARGDGYGGYYRLEETGCQKGASSGIENERERVRCDFGRIGTEGLTANANSDTDNAGSGPDRKADSIQKKHRAKQLRTRKSGRTNQHDDAADTSSSGWEKLNPSTLANGSGHPAGCNPSDWSEWPTQSPLCAGNDGLSAGLVRHAARREEFGDQPIGWRNNAIKAGGNAIVPQVVYQIFKAINEVNQTF